MTFAEAIKTKRPETFTKRVRYIMKMLLYISMWAFYDKEAPFSVPFSFDCFSQDTTFWIEKETMLLLFLRLKFRFVLVFQSPLIQHIPKAIKAEIDHIAC